MAELVKLSPHRPTFILGFGITCILLGVCAAHFLSPWREAILLAFTRDSGYVAMPKSFQYPCVVAVLLNFPAVGLTAVLLHAMDGAVGVPPGPRAAAFLGLLLVTSACWWWAVAMAIAWAQRRQSASTGAQSKKNGEETTHD